MSNATNVRVKWYRTPLDKETLARLNTKSDARAFAQTLGHFGLCLLCGGAALYGVHHWSWYVVAALVFAYGTFTSFAINAVHELGHKSVFKTQWLNSFFVRIFAFVGWIHSDHFYSSHMRHHQYTLHAPDDLEVVLPMRLMTKHFFKTGFVQPLQMIGIIKNTWRLANGRFGGEWEDTLFPSEKLEKRRPVIRWARFLLVGHATILVVSISLPPCPHGLLATWQEISSIQRKQDADPNYQHIAPLPQNHAAV